MMLNAKLVVVGGDAKSGEVRLKLPTVIGRGKEAGLTIPHALVSRSHAEIFEKDGRLFVRDLGSLNGTFVNDRRIEADQPLEPSQLLTLGNVTFRAVYEIDQDTQHAFPGNETVEFDEVDEVETESSVEDEDESSGVATSGVPFDETVPVDVIASSISVAASASEGVPESSSSGPMGESNVFSVEEPGNGEGHSVSVSAIDHLPTAQPGVSFAGNIELEEGQPKPLSAIDPIEVDLGGDGNAAEVVGESGLGSFLNKFPH